MEQSVFKLKAKIKDNLLIRLNTTIQCINHEIRDIFTDKKDYYFGLTLLNKNELLPEKFNVSPSLLSNALIELFNKVDEWPGVGISCVQKPLTQFKSYWIIADNWWNRYKSEWIGNYFFFPLFKDELFKYILKITKSYKSLNYINKQRNEYELNSTRELLYFLILKKVMHSEVHFNRTRAQPLILDQSYEKSDYLRQFYHYLADEHSVPWTIPPNVCRYINFLVDMYFV